MVHFLSTHKTGTEPVSSENKDVTWKLFNLQVLEYLYESDRVSNKNVASTAQLLLG